MYAVQTTPLDLPTQSVLRKDVESLCSAIFSSKLHAEAMHASGDNVDATRLQFIDSAEVLATYICKKLRIEYSPGLVNTFAPLIGISGSDPLRLDLISTLTSVCQRVLPHLAGQKSLQSIAKARRPLLKWLLLYHAPTIAFHLDQHFHTWSNPEAEKSSGGVIPDSWVASMFESEKEREFDFLIRVWDCCLLLDASAPAVAATRAFPSTAMCFVVVFLIARAEKKLLRMEGDQLRHCMAQTLVDVLKDPSETLIAGVQKLVEATPPSFCVKLRDAGHVLPPVVNTAPSSAATGDGVGVLKNTPSSQGMFSLISASTNGVKELSNMMISMPGNLLNMVPLTSPTSAGTKEDPNAHSKQEVAQDPDQVAGSALAMTLSASEVVLQVFQSFQGPIVGESIRYFIIDCRSLEEVGTGQIPTAFHFDPDAVTDPQVLDQVLATLNPMKATVHLCVMGQGYGHIAREIGQQQLNAGDQKPPMPSPFELTDEFFEAYSRDLTRVNSAVLFLMKRGFPHVSVLQGGYAAAHSELFHSKAFAVDDLIDHDVGTCQLCLHHRCMDASAPSPAKETAVASPATASAVTAGTTAKSEDSNKMTGSRGNSSTALPAQKQGPLDAKSLFDAHTSSSNSYLSSFAGALKTSGKTLLNPADSLKESTKWFSKKPAAATDGAAAATGKPEPPSPSSSAPLMTANFSKFRSSIAQIGSESLDMLKKAEQAAVGKTRMSFGSAPAAATAAVGGKQTGSSSSTPVPSPSMARQGSGGHSERNSSFQKSEEEVFTIDDDDEEEQDDFIGGGSSRTSSASSHRNDSFASGGTGDSSHNGAVQAPLHDVAKGKAAELKKGMRVSRVQMLPLVGSPFFSGYKKKKLAPATPGATSRVSMLPRHLVILENHIVVLKAERNMDDVYQIKSCHHLAHLARMTCLKKNALMVTIYYKWQADGRTIEKRNGYEVQQRDEFIKVIKTAMEKM